MSVSMSFLALCRKLFAFSLLSRLLGLVRDLAIAWLVGAGPAADLLAQALRLPHIFRRLLAEGSLSLALTSVFVQLSLPKGRLLYWALHRRLFWLLGLLLIFALLCSQPLARLLSASAQEAQKLLPLLALALPYILFAGMAALSMSYLHARRSFTVPASSPLIFNCLVLLWVLLASFWPEHAVPVIVCGVSLAGLAQWLWQEWPLRRRSKLWKEADFSKHELQSEARTILAAQPQGLLAAATPHLALLCAMIFLASYGPGQVSALFYAERLLELPLGLIGICLGMASLPHLSLAASRRHFGRFARKLERALHISVLLTLPAMTGLWALAPALTCLLFGHGHFAAEDLPHVAEMLVLLLPLLPAQALGRIELSACMALGAWRMASACTLACLGLIVILCWCGLHPVIAVACGLTGYAMFLWFWLVRVLVRQGARLRFAPRFLLCALSCALCCALCAQGGISLALFLDWGAAAQVLLGVSAGLLAWLIALRLLRQRDLWRLKKLLGQQGQSPKN